MLPSSTDLLVLHGLRLKGMVGAADLANLIGLTPSETQWQLELASEAGQARFRDGPNPGWSLTAEGRKENERLLAEELDDAGRRAEVRACYRRFLELNQRLLQACTDWQVKDQQAQTLNDHRDADYDAAVIADLQEIHRLVHPICAELAGWFDRFGTYARRFDSAIDRLVGGEADWFTKPTIDSFHTVWFELHEDLLATLGLDRASERTQESD